MTYEDTGESGEAYNIEHYKQKIPIGSKPRGDWHCRICGDLIPFQQTETIQLHKIYHILERIEIRLP